MSKGKIDAAAGNQNGTDNTMTKRKKDKGKKPIHVYKTPHGQ